MLEAFTVVVVFVVGCVFAWQGLFAACTMFVNFLLAGLICFNIWEPIADALELFFRGSIIQGYEDFLSLIFSFWIFLSVFRILTNYLAPQQIDFDPLLQHVGGGVMGLLLGYLASGLLVCAMQTLPWDERFLGFDPSYSKEDVVRRYIPADRVWLAMMHRASAGPFASGDGTFDADGSFTIRYARDRRFRSRGTQSSGGERP
ncbi:MAG: hypothetical protein KatS3mg105_0684 [Gemmatales bacterium]|nr:MAG: hypothetical protein KatS3mg105_0684 [Gemmatales bacterium]